MKLAVTNDWYDKKSAVFWNKDGILKALDVLRSRGHEIVFFKKHEKTFIWDHDYVTLSFSPDPAQQVRSFKPDVILFFCDFSRPILGELADYPCKKAICYSGGRFTDYMQVPDIVFVESKSYVDWMKPMGLNVVQAFGTNTEVFKPFKQTKVFDAVMTATFARWKRQWLFAEAMGPRGLVCGWWQDREADTWQICQEKGTPLLHHQMPESINLLMNMSHTVLLTADDTGGSQRSVLEAMAAGIPPVVMSDSTMTTEYVREAGFGKIVDPNPEAIREAVEALKGTSGQAGIDYIKSKYTQGHYANQIEHGLNSLF